LAYVIWLGLGLGVDHMYQRAANKAHAVKEKSREQLDQFQAQLEEARDSILNQDHLEYARQATETTRSQVQEKIQTLIQTGLEAMQNQDNLKVIQELFQNLLSMLQQACQQYNLSEETLVDLQKRLQDFLQQVQSRFPDSASAVERMQSELERVLTTCRDMLNSPTEKNDGGDKNTKATPWAEEAQKSMEQRLEATKRLVQGTQMARNLQKKWQDAFRGKGGDDGDEKG